MANELSALLEVAGETVDRLAITPSQSLHRAIARRSFSAVGPLAAPVRLVHDGISNTVYTAIRTTASALTAGAASAVKNWNGGADHRPLSASRSGRQALSVLNALIGDLLEEHGSDLAIEMSVRHAGHDVATSVEELRAAYPDATGKVAVFLHGLAENEESWLRGSSRHDGGDALPFGARLHADLGITPVDVRYNTGLHVSENGSKLDLLLEQLIAAWPVELRELSLIGHSMGGLVARSAYAAATAAKPGRRWPALTTRVVTLGTPHTGAPLEKAARLASWALQKVPEAEPLADILDTRSSGIRDLRHGYLLGDEWRAEDPKRLFDDRRSAVPLLHGCTHVFITASVTRDPSNPLGWIAGDLLVRTDSASGRHRTRAIPVPPELIVHVGSLTHFDLLDHPLVYERLRAALTPPA